VLGRTSVACRDLTVDERNTLLDAIHDGVAVFQHKGELTESWFSHRGIPDDDCRWEKKEKDERSPHRRRAVMFTHKKFQERVKEQEKEKEAKEEEKQNKQEKREKNKEKKEKKIDTVAKRKLALQHGAKRKRADDVICHMCPVSYHAYQDYGLKELIVDRMKGENVWGQCEFCKDWFCPEHTDLLTGRSGHEAACKIKKSQSKASK